MDKDKNINSFGRYRFTKEMHENAREEREIYQKQYGEKLPYSSFLRKETPLKQNVIAYEVSYQVSYRGSFDHITIAPKTFVVYGYRGQENTIKENTINMLVDSKGHNTGNNFNSNTMDAIKSGSRVQVKPRGLETSQKPITDSDYTSLKTKGFVVKELDTTIKMKNKKGREGKLDLDLRHWNL